MFDFFVSPFAIACSSDEDILFSDVAHSDEAHSDEAHSDEAHSDEAHSDEAHSDEYLQSFNFDVDFSVELPKKVCSTCEWCFDNYPEPICACEFYGEKISEIQSKVCSPCPGWEISFSAFCYVQSNPLV